MSTLDAAEIAAALPAVLTASSRPAFEELLAPNVRWGGQEDNEQTCHNRTQAGDTYAALLTAGTRLAVLHTSANDDKILTRIEVSEGDATPVSTFQTSILLTVRDGLVVDILQLDDHDHDHDHDEDDDPTAVETNG